MQDNKLMHANEEWWPSLVDHSAIVDQRSQSSGKRPSGKDGSAKSLDSSKEDTLLSRGPDWPLYPNTIRGAEYSRLLKAHDNQTKFESTSSPYTSALLKNHLHVKEERSRWMNRAIELSEEYGVSVPDNWTTHATFMPEDLVSHHIISSAIPFRNDLKNEIHPLFDFSNWKNVPQTVHDFITPSLRIASRYLTHPACSQFWITLLFGERESDAFQISRFGQYCERIKHSPPITAENFQEVQAWLFSLAEKHIVTFHFNDQVATSMQIPTNYGATNFVHYSEVRKSSWPEGWKNVSDGQRHWHVPVFLHHDFLRVIHKRSEKNFSDDNQRLRFYWLFSVVLTHELVHAISFVWMNERSLRENVPIPNTEPFFHDEPESENGWSWESFTFGSCPEAINQDVNCRYGLSHSPFPRQRIPVAPENTDPDLSIAVEKTYAIPMWWIARIQTEGMWEKSGHYELVQNLKLPTINVPVAWVGHRALVPEEQDDGGDEKIMESRNSESDEEDGEIKIDLKPKSVVELLKELGVEDPERFAREPHSDVEGE